METTQKTERKEGTTKTNVCKEVGAVQVYLLPISKPFINVSHLIQYPPLLKKLLDILKFRMNKSKNMLFPTVDFMIQVLFI